MTEPATSSPDLLMAMLSALPSELLYRAAGAARGREFEERRRRENFAIANAEFEARERVMEEFSRMAAPGP